MTKEWIFTEEVRKKFTDESFYEVAPDEYWMCLDFRFVVLQPFRTEENTVFVMRPEDFINCWLNDVTGPSCNEDTRFDPDEADEYRRTLDNWIDLCLHAKEEILKKTASGASGSTLGASG